MVLKRVSTNPSSPAGGYSVKDGAKSALNQLFASIHRQIPTEFLNHLQDVSFIASMTPDDEVLLPCPLREQEATAAIKALEACAAAAIADLRYGTKPRSIEVDLTRTACFLISAYITTVDGMSKTNQGIKCKLPGQSATMTKR
jgi:hypothetical protein